MKKTSTIARVARVHEGLSTNEVAQVNALEGMKRKLRAELREASQRTAQQIGEINDQIALITRRKGQRAAEDRILRQFNAQVKRAQRSES